MLYIICAIVYFICAIYLIGKNKNKTQNKNNDDDDYDNEIVNYSNNHDKFYSVIVLIFAFIMLLQYLTIKAQNTHTYSILLFLTLYTFAALPNFVFFTIFDNSLIKSKIVSLAIGLYTIITSYLLYALNKYELVSGYAPSGLMSWGAIKALTTNHFPMFFIFSLFSGFLLAILLVNLFITQTLLIHPARYIFLAVAAGLAGFITYLYEMVSIKFLDLPFNGHKYLHVFVPLALIIGSFSSIIAVFGY